MSVPSLRALWEAREELKPDPRLLRTLAKVQRNRLPGSGIARRIEIHLRPGERQSIDVEGLSSAEIVTLNDKRILLLSLRHESPSLHQLLANRIQTTTEPLDLFIHYPYCKDPQAKELVVNSYSAKDAYSLDTPLQKRLFGDEVRFHYCDLRLEWLNKGKGLKERLQLLGDYSDYLLDGDVNRFTRRLHRNAIEFQDLLHLDKSLLLLEGKIQKSYEKAEPGIRDEILSRYDEVTGECRTRMEAVKQEIFLHANVPIELYLKWIAEINCLYQHLNAAYCLMRLFRHFDARPDRHSDDPVNCIVVLPESMIHIIHELLPKLEGVKGGVGLIDEWFH